MAGDMYLENIEEYVLDEDKVVTYKWLSQTLSLHVNQAKQMLEKFVQEQRNKPNSTAINVTYLLSGEQETDTGVKVNKVVIVREDELQSTESKFSKVLGKHVYSVQKSLLKDVNPLYMVDYQITKENIMKSNKHSAIQCSEAKPRSTEQLEVLEQRARTMAGSDEPTLVNGHASPEKPKASDSTVSKSGSSSTSSSSRAKKKGPLDMFASKVASKGSKVNKESKDESKGKKEEPVAEKKEDKKPAKSSSKPKGGMMAFLSRANTTSKPKQTTSSQVKGDSKKEDKEVKKEKEDSDKEVEKPKKTSAVDKRRAAEIEVSDSDSDDNSSKKRVKRVVKQGRRRIIQQDISSSSSEEDDDEDDEPIPPTPPPATRIPSDDEEEEEEEKMEVPKETEKPKESSTTPGGRRRKRKRVLKNKTSVDEDGCMVTEKVWESESTDASDEEPPPRKKKTAPASKVSKDEDEGSKKGNKKKTPPSKGKQSNLMSFFKKK